jgi:hypothetical protein
MANTDAAFGFKPVGHALGLDWTQCVNPYYFAAGESTATFKYDLVSLAGSSDTLGEYPTIAQTAAAGAILGVVIGFSNTPYISADVTNLARKYRPASTAMYGWVVDDPFVIYEAQEDSDTNDMDADMVGLATDIAVGSGNTTTGISAMELDSSDTATGAGQMRILGLVRRGTNALGSYAIWRCMINEHQLLTATDV